MGIWQLVPSTFKESDLCGSYVEVANVESVCIREVF